MGSYETQEDADCTRSLGSAESERSYSSLPLPQVAGFFHLIRLFLYRLSSGLEPEPKEHVHTPRTVAVEWLECVVDAIRRDIRPDASLQISEPSVKSGQPNISPFFS